MAAEYASAALTTIITLVVVIGGALIAGFWLLSRRKLRFGPAERIDKTQQEANILLVRADDAVNAAEDEVAFAIAQFGEKKAAPFVAALSLAQQQLREAFELQQKLDDSFPDTLTQRRDWSNRIAMLCRSAQSALEQQTAEFRGLRSLESSAPETHRALLERRDGLAKARDAASATLNELAEHYAPRALASVADNVRRADDALKLAGELLTESAQSMAAGNNVGDQLLHVTEHLATAEHLIDAIDTLKTELAKAERAAADLRSATKENLAEARALRDSPPDAASSNAVASAMREVEEALAGEALAGKGELADPLVELERLRQANAALDASMAGARNQQRRLDGARTALAGALVQARSQLAATGDYIAGRRGGVGAAARTRLAEAQRLLMLAEAEADPVAALDLARSSATHSRDADALARYDLLRA